eukprot:COSAG02_NODE_725_length_18021_cov_392.218279_12_plen_1174_part_00
MEALERAQAAGDDQSLRQILEQLNARAASAAAGQPEPQPEAEPTVRAAVPATQPKPASALASAETPVLAEAASAEAENAAIEAATKAALEHAAQARAEAEAARRRGSGAAKLLGGKRPKKESTKARKKESTKPPQSPSKVSAEQERADTAGAQAAVLTTADEQPASQPMVIKCSAGVESSIDASQHGAATAAVVGVRPRYKAVASGVIRSGVEMNSEKAGKLVVGEVFVALATQVVGDTTRVQCDRGWVSARAKSGKKILQLLDANSALSSSPPSPSSSSESESDSESEEVAAAAAEAEKWRVVRGSEFVYTDLPREELARRREWVLAVPLFSGLDESLADSVARVFEPRKVDRNTMVIAKGATAEQEMYFIAKGNVEVLTSLDTPPFATLGVGKFIGESSLLDNTPRNAFVFARKAALLYVLRKSDLKPILRKSPEAEVQMTTALQQHMNDRAEQREAMEHLFEGGRLWKALLDSSSDEENEQAGESQVMEDKLTDTPSVFATPGPKDSPPQQQDGQAQQPPQAAAPQAKPQKPLEKKVSSTDSPVKRSVALLKAASAEDKLIKAGDKSRVSEALRLYNQVLEVLEEALASDSTSTKIKETLGKKKMGVRKRVKVLAEAQQALESAQVAAEKAQKARIEVEEELATIKATSASANEQKGPPVPQTAQAADDALAAAPAAEGLLPETKLVLSSGPGKPATVAEDGQNLEAAEHASTRVEFQALQSPLKLPPVEPAPRPSEDEALQTDAAEFFASVKAGVSSKSSTAARFSLSGDGATSECERESTPDGIEQLQQSPQTGSRPQFEPQTTQPETESVGFKVVMDWTPRTIDASTRLQAEQLGPSLQQSMPSLDGGPLDVLLSGLKTETDAGAGGSRAERAAGTRVDSVSPRLRNRPPSLIVQPEEVLLKMTAPTPGASGSTASAQVPSTVAQMHDLASTASASASTPSGGGSMQPSRASQQEPRIRETQFHVGQAIEVLSESLGGWQKAKVTGVTREMIRVEYAGRHRYINLQDSSDPMPYRIPPSTARNSTSTSLASARVTSKIDRLKASSFRSVDMTRSHITTNSPKSSFLSSLHRSIDWESTQQPGSGSLRPLSGSPGNSPTSSMDGELQQSPRVRSRPNGDIYALEAMVSSQLRVLLGSGLRDEGEEKLLQDLGSALAVLDRAVHASGAY